MPRIVISDIPEPDVPETAFERPVAECVQKRGRSPRALPVVVGRKICVEVQRGIGSEGRFDPVQIRLLLLRRIVPPRNHEIGQLKVAAGLVFKDFAGGSDRRERSAAHRLVELLAEPLDVDVGGIDERISARAGSGSMKPLVTSTVLRPDARASFAMSIAYSIQRVGSL